MATPGTLHNKPTPKSVPTNPDNTHPGMHEPNRHRNPDIGFVYKPKRIKGIGDRGFINKPKRDPGLPDRGFINKPAG